MATNKIALCRMFSGAYWKNPTNIGFESINMFLPDNSNGESYIYLPADGDYSLKDHNIRYILLTQHISKKFVEDVTTSENANPPKTPKSIVKVIGFAEVVEEILKDNYKNLYPNDVDLSNYKCIGGEVNLKKLQEVLSSKNKASALFKQAEILSEIHKTQEPLAEEIKYNGMSLKDIFKSNTSLGPLNIYISLKVKDLKFPQKNIYLTNDNDSKAFSNFILKDDVVITTKQSPSSISQTTFIDYEHKIISNIESCCEWIGASKLDIDKFEKDFEPSFLTLIKKENDELSYSNLFAYFLANSSFCEQFFDGVAKSQQLAMSSISSAQVVREEENIDILVKSTNDIVVIENKIKSALNGHFVEDINGEQFRNQLVKYYTYIEKNYKNCNKHYFIFAPDYNSVNQENFGIVDLDGKQVNMKEVWHIVRYSTIYEICSKYGGFENTNEKSNYDQFVKALKVHTVESLQNYYRDMQVRMRKLFLSQI